MHYYEHHLGDYAEATAHLSFVEDAAYSRILRKYYSTEKPMPADVKEVQRLVGARSKDEREAVDTVLSEFFDLYEDGWHNKRCDEEIARYQDKQAKAKRSANARWGKHKTHSEGNAGAMRTHSEGNANQTPSTKHQAPEVNQSVSHTVSDPERPPGETSAESAPVAPVSIAGAVCMAIREEGIPTANHSHPTLAALIAAGADANEFRQAAREAVRKGKPDFAYVVGTVRRRREEAAELVLHKGRMPNKQEALEEANRSATAGWKPPELREQTA